MKKLVAIFAFVANVVSVGLGAVSDAEFKEIKEMQDKCYDKIELTSCEKLCDLKDGDGCGMLSAFYSSEKNHSKAFHYAQIACDLESALGCLLLSSFYLEGKGVAKDIEKGYGLGGKAVCNLKLKAPTKFFNEIIAIKPNEACYKLGAQYHNGQEVAQDYSKAAHYYQIACDLKNAYGCDNLGWLYYSGKGIKANKNKAKEFFGKACDLGFQDGCDNYKKMVISSPKRGL